MAPLVLVMLFALAGSAAASKSTILDKLALSSHTGFANLVELANLPKDVTSSPDITVFAPTDDSLMYKTSPALLAFLKLPANIEVLRKVVLFHLVPKRISAFKWNGEVTTMEGSKLTLTLNSLSFFVGDIPLKQYSTLANDDGVIHSISGVMIPPGLEDSLKNINEMVEEVDDDGRRILVVASALAPTGAASPPPETPPPESSPPGSPLTSTTPSPPPKSSAGRVINVAVLLVTLFVSLCLLW